MLAINFSMLIVFILFLTTSLSKSTKIKDSFQIPSDNNDVVVKREIENLRSNISRTNINNLKKNRGVLTTIYKVPLWKNPIPYYVDKRVDRGLIFSLLKNIELETCIRFKPIYKVTLLKPSIKYDYVRPCKIKRNKFLKHYVDPKCYTIGYTYRETLHTLGLVYEHQRKERNSFIYLNTAAIDKSVEKYFDRIHISICDTELFHFDYGSVLLPDQHFLSVKGPKTMVPAFHLYQKTMGQNFYPSFLDFKRLNYYYCNKKCHQKITCKHGGYPHPELCTQCKCVLGYTGRYCERFVKPTRSCPTPLLVATSTERVLLNRGMKKCAYALLAPKGKHIFIKILSGVVYPESQDICTPFNTLEVKYFADKATTGARFCGHLPRITILSKNNIVLIYFKSKDHRNNFAIRFKAF
uniref:Metalloendopeptidase n=1 Tax=Strongyloides stercoralis TaxID=6248 RepID=A0A0K0ENW5_STRER